jgi:hypothetical protein
LYVSVKLGGGAGLVFSKSDPKKIYFYFAIEKCFLSKIKRFASSFNGYERNSKNNKVKSKA